MIYGFCAHFIIFAYPRVFHNKERTISEIIELVTYWTLFAMMIWSHIHCMCSDPGRIPLKYQYQDEKLPDKFKKIII